MSLINRLRKGLVESPDGYLSSLTLLTSNYLVYTYPYVCMDVSAITRFNKSADYNTMERKGFEC